MSETQLIERLIQSKEYSALKSLRPEFNFFTLLGDALREPAWSRIFSGILDSTLPHGLEDAAFRRWLANVEEELNSRKQTLPLFFRDLPRKLVVRTQVEFSTPAGRRLDILVRVFDSNHSLVAVVGIENKLDSPEQPSQIADYQSALSEVFPEVHRLIVYLTPDRREAQTADGSSPCPCLPASYRTMVQVCRELETRAEPNVSLLLQSLSLEIESVVLGEDRMKTEAKALIKNLWSDSDHRKAMRLIIECVPTPRQLWDTELLTRIRQEAEGLGMQIGEILYYPATSINPRQIKICCGGEIEERSGPLDFYLLYMLHCEDPNPDIGSEFRLHLMAWCESEQGRRHAKDLRLEQKLPPSGARRNWSSLESIWTGGVYVLRDFDRRDVDGLAKLFCEGVRQTYPAIAAAIINTTKSTRKSPISAEGDD